MTGGLGNQMFIYAMYLQMKQLFPDTRIDLSDMQHYHAHYGYEMHKVFNLPKEEFCINQTLKKIIEFCVFKTILERKQHGSLMPYRQSYAWPFIYFKGFYQSERYFEEVKPLVRQKFTFNMAIINDASRAMAQKIDTDAHAVSLHVRRGDYLLPKFWKSTGSVCSLNYYMRAIDTILSTDPAASFYIFSDDMAWVKENLRIPNATYVDFNKADDSWQDMMLMSHCRHHIICNSTFSWWGAWLSQHADGIVIAPERWFNGTDAPHICPERWTKVAVD